MNASLQPDAPARARMHPDEWQARVQLAACYRVFVMLGWTELIYNHITVRLLKNIGSKRLAILRNHGLLAWAPSLPLAFSRLWTLQRACDVQVAPAALVPARVAEKTTRDALQFDAKFGGGLDVFDAMRRLVDRNDTSYRQ